MEQSRTITQKSASNLALAFILLPKEKRDSMATLYAFCREVDDVADEDRFPIADRRKRLDQWRKDISLAVKGEKPEFQVNQELQPVIRRYGLKLELFHELIAGCEMDLQKCRYATMEELEAYCYRVASVVGLLSIDIFGYKNHACKDYAVSLGKALQLTNILRDVATDAEKGRIYLPADALSRFGVSEQDILEGKYSDSYFKLASSIGEHAKRFYLLARTSLPNEDRKSMIAAELMGSVYWRLLCKLEKRGYDVFHRPPTRLGKLHKVFLILRTWLRLASGMAIPNYGTS